jgi:hydroxymethylbilane synthase
MATRLAIPGSNGVDAVVAAAAALIRLGEDERVSERLDPSWFVPQVGQGAIALESRTDNAAVLSVLAQINDADAFACVSAERAFLAELGLGCSIPAGAHAVLRGGVLSLSGVMIGVDGSASVRSSLDGTNPEALGTQLALLLRDEMGGGSLTGWETLT